MKTKYSVKLLNGSTVTVEVPFSGNAWRQEDAAARLAEDTFGSGVDYICGVVR